MGRAETHRGYSHREILKILAGLLLAMLTSMISTSIVTTALPTIVGELGGQEHLAWVVSAHLLATTVSVPLWGKLSDLFGRKPVFQGALAIFVAASLVAGLAQNMGMLIAARAAQGLGTGGVQALTQVIIGDVAEPRERGRYNGYLGAAFGVATVSGPLLGGFLVDADGLGWRWCFYACVPVAVVAAVMIQRVLRLPRVRRDTRIDLFGATTITGGAAALLLLLSLGGVEFPWRSWWTVLLGTASLVLCGLAVLAERRAADPILPPRLFRDRTFVLAGLASLLLGTALFSAMSYLPQYLQIARGLSPTHSGLMMLPMVLAMITASTVSGRLVTRTGRWKAFPVTGMLLIASGLLLLSRTRVDTPLWQLGVKIAVLGIGFGLSTHMLILAVQNAVRRADMAVATSGVGFLRTLGGAVGVAVFGAVLNGRLAAELTARMAAANLRPPAQGLGLGTPEAVRALPPVLQGIVLEAFTAGLRTVFLVGVPAAVLGFLAVVCLRELPLRSSRRSGEERPGAAAPAAPGRVPGDGRHAPSAAARAIRGRRARAGAGRGRTPSPR